MQVPRKSKTVLKALEILEEVFRFDEGISNAALAARLDLHPSTTHRLLNTLVSQGYLSKDENLYRIGYKVLQLQCLTDQNANLRQCARSLLIELEHQTNFTTNLAIRDGRRAILIDIIKGSKNLVVNNSLGSSVPLHASAIGKSLLAFLPKEKQEALVRQLELESYTPKTITNYHELLRELEISSERGYTIDDEEFVIGIRCIGTAIVNKEKDVIAAISLSGLTSQIQEAEIETLANKMLPGRKSIFLVEGVALRTQEFPCEHMG